MNIEKAKKIEGWMLHAELEWLATRAQEHKLIVEIGSYCGRSTRALGDNTLGKVYAVDLWYGPGGNGNSKPPSIDQDSLVSSGVPWSEEDRAMLYDCFCTNLKDLIDAKTVIPVKVDHSMAWLKDELNCSPDMIFIDGDHSWEGAKRDAQMWYPRLAKGGLFCGHDGNQPAVMSAAQFTAPNIQLVPNTTIWWTIKQ